MTKITLVMIPLAAYYDWLPLEKVSHPLWVAVPVLIILIPHGARVAAARPRHGVLRGRPPLVVFLLGGVAVVLWWRGGGWRGGLIPGVSASGAPGGPTTET